MYCNNLQEMIIGKYFTDLINRYLFSMHCEQGLDLGSGDSGVNRIDWRTEHLQHLHFIKGDSNKNMLSSNGKKLKTNIKKNNIDKVVGEYGSPILIKYSGRCLWNDAEWNEWTMKKSEGKGLKVCVSVTTEVLR